MRSETKAKKKAAVVRRRQEALMRDFIELDGVQCGHRDCKAFNAGAHAIAAALDWSLEQQVPTEWLTDMIAHGLLMAMMANRLMPEDVTGEKAGVPPCEVN